MRTRCVCIMLYLLLWGCNSGDKPDLIILKNAQIEVGVLPEIGGRVVLLRKPGCGNILKTDEKQWIDPESQRPEISAFSDFKAFNGHIVWIGPQADWWINQDINTDRRDKKADWPPDPYLIFADYKIISQTSDHLKMAGPASPVSGVRLTKEVSITPEGLVIFNATAENIRNEPVRIDLWMNTRLDGFARGYVPVDGDGNAEFIHQDTETGRATDYRINQGYFYFDPQKPAGEARPQVQEVHLYPSMGYLAGFSAGQLLLIRFDKIRQSLIHPKHGLVELYNYIDAAGSDNLLELEVHSAYQELLPGESMTWSESWQVIPYNGKSDPEAQITFLKNQVGQR